MIIPSVHSPFVEIKSGDESPAIVIAHGLSGTVQVSELARHIHTGNPIFGIRAKGVDDSEEPLDRVEDMAAYYLDALQQLPFEDPIILIGYSFGGLVALEMAQRLLAQGKRVALLVLLDTYPHPRFLRAPQRVRLFFRRMRRHAMHMWKLPLKDASSYVSEGIKRRLHFSDALHRNWYPPGLTDRELSLRQVNQRLYSAYTNYQPKFYPGKIQFVTTATRSFFPSDPATVWAKLTPELKVEVVPGDHLNIVTTHFKPLAEALTRFAREVNAAQPQAVISKE